MCFGGGGGGFLQQISNAIPIKTPFDDLNHLANAALQITTLGTVGVNDKGQIGVGVIGGAIAHGATEVIGEISGRNAARDTTYNNNVALDNATAQNASNLKAQKQQKQNNDIAASSTAGALRATSAAAYRNSLGGIGISNSSSGDYLGL